MAKMGTFLFWFVITTFGMSFFPVVVPASGTTKHFKFNIRKKNVTRLCHTRSILTVNGQFPGPPIAVREGDRVVVEVVNHVPNNVTIHWHGVRQIRSGWYDGPEYIAQCPIQQGQKYVYNFTIIDQRGTLWWHAHVSWLRATLYGPIVILPKPGVPYPFPKPHKEIVMIFGEWFNHDTEAIINLALETGAEPIVSNAYTINGLPGPLYSCSAQDTFKLTVTPGKTYLLRLINAALNDELFFAIAHHSMTVVEVDALYVKPFKTSRLIIAPGQTTNVLLKAKPHIPSAKFLMEARPYESGGATFDATTVAGILQYESQSTQQLPLLSPILPSIRDTAFVTYFSSRLRSLNSPEYPARVPRHVDRRFMFTVGLGTNPCPMGHICEGPILGTKFAASVNNVSFQLPSTAILQAHYFGRPDGVYTTDFPTHPAPFDYTGLPLINTNVLDATKVVVLPFNTTVELVMQDTSIISYENHPLHLHGNNFFILGQGFGNYDPATDPSSFNLVDPPERNTVGVPAGGWVAIRFLADNPGVWYMHCHLDVHLSWGLRMAWIVEDGELPSQKLPPPPPDLPEC